MKYLIIQVTVIKNILKCIKKTTLTDYATIFYVQNLTQQHSCVLEVRGYVLKSFSPPLYT